MRDFSDFAEPIANEILALYPERASDLAEKTLGGFIIEKTNSRDCYIIRENENVHFFNIVPKAKELWNAINDWAGKASTYEGELDWWMYKEEQRVHNLARDIIIRRLKGLYSYKVYECENYHEYYKGDSEAAALWAWVKNARDNYSNITITAYSREDELKLMKFVRGHESEFVNACNEHKVPYKIDYLLKGIQKNYEGNAKIQWEHDQVFPFCFG